MSTKFLCPFFSSFVPCSLLAFCEAIAGFKVRDTFRCSNWHSCAVRIGGEEIRRKTPSLGSHQPGFIKVNAPVYETEVKMTCWPK